MSDCSVYLSDNDFAEECALALIDNVRNEMAMFEAMIGIDLYESKLMKENPVNEGAITALNEASNQGIISKIIEMIKSFFKKIRDIFRSFFKKTSSETKSPSDVKKQIQQRAKQDKEKISNPDDNKSSGSNSATGDEGASTKSALPSADEMSFEVFAYKCTPEEATRIEVDIIEHNSTVFPSFIDEKYFTMDKQQIIIDLLGCKPEEYEEKLINNFIGKRYKIKLKDLGGITGLADKMANMDKQIAWCENYIDNCLHNGSNKIKEIEDKLRKQYNEEDNVQYMSGEMHPVSEVYRIQAAYNESVAIRSKALMKVLKMYSKMYHNIFDQVMTDKNHVIVFE